AADRPFFLLRSRSWAEKRTERGHLHESHCMLSAAVKDMRCISGDSGPNCNFGMLRTTHALHRRLSDNCRSAIRVVYISESPSDTACRHRREGNCNLHLAGAPGSPVDRGMVIRLAGTFRRKLLIR